MKSDENYEPDYGYHDFQRNYNKTFKIIFISILVLSFISLILLMIVPIIFPMMLKILKNFIPNLGNINFDENFISIFSTLLCLLSGIAAIGYSLENFSEVSLSTRIAKKNWDRKIDEVKTEKDPKRLREITEKGEINAYFDLVNSYLENVHLPSDVIHIWLFDNVRCYGLKAEFICGAPIDYNMRERIMILCVTHPNISKDDLNKLTQQILSNKKCLNTGMPYFIEHLYPEDDLNLIRNILENSKLDGSLKCQLKEYYDYRVDLQKDYTNPNIDECGFALWRKYY